MTWSTWRRSRRCNVDRQLSAKASQHGSKLFGLRDHGVQLTSLAGAEFIHSGWPSVLGLGLLCGANFVSDFPATYSSPNVMVTRTCCEQCRVRFVRCRTSRTPTRFGLSLRCYS